MRLSEAELERWGRSVGERIATPAVIALSGPLGAGKSVLARAIGRGAGVAEPMPSPTYNMAFRYLTPSGREVVHFDLHRLGSADEVWELGWEQLGAEGEIVLVEWPERAEGLLPVDHWLVKLSVPRDARTLRDVDVSRVGDPPDLPSFPLSVTHTEA